MSDDLLGAFAEAESIAEAAIAEIEKKLGLVGQPRAIVFHEENGRRHVHCVCSRIKADTMTAVKLPHYKRKLGDATRELFRRHNKPTLENEHLPLAIALCSVATTKNSASKNGMLGIVKTISEKKLIVTIDGEEKRTINFDPRLTLHGQVPQSCRYDPPS